MPPPTAIKKIEIIANLSVLVVSVFLSVALAKNYLFSTSRQKTTDAVVAASTGTTPANPRLQFGSALSIPGIAWAEGERTLVLALSTTCHFCSESAPLYHQILRKKSTNTRVVAVLPQTIDDSHGYLNKLGLSVDQVVQVPLGSIGVAGTPTLILVGSNGAIVNSWRGKLAATKEEEVINQIR